MSIALCDAFVYNESMIVVFERTPTKQWKVQPSRKETNNHVYSKRHS